jgi:serine/threonine-protein kinase HipA
VKKPAGTRESLNVRRTVSVCIGGAGTLVGELAYIRQGAREHASFAYDSAWLARPNRFTVSSDLDLCADPQRRRAPTAQDSVFHHAFADTAPDGWGRRIVARDHAKRRVAENLPPLLEIDYLLAVDDFSRIGALRLRDSGGNYLRTTAEGRRSTPPVADLQRIYEACHALELNEETAADLRYLQGKATSLGGLRPKCTVVDRTGRLSLGKFPSVNDEHDVTRAEVLAMHLARRAGIEVASARIEEMQKMPVAVIERFDRTPDDLRIPYLSAASLLQASANEERSYFDIADAIRAHGVNPAADVRQLWRRLVFNLLITNVDDHLHNMGFLHVQKGLWRLAPAFDLNPFPGRTHESKTWLSEEDGPITAVSDLMARASYFSLDSGEALAVLAEVVHAVSQWKAVAVSAAVGLKAGEAADLAPAFEHDQMLASRSLLNK